MRRPSYTPRALRKSKAIRAAAWTVVAAGVAAPLVRRRMRLPKPAVLATAAAAPVALCVALPRTRARDVADVRAADVGLPGGLRDAARRPRGAARGACGSTTRCGSTACSASAMPPTLRLQRLLSAPGRDAPLREGARVDALGVVRGPARGDRLRADPPARALRPRRRARRTRSSTSARSSTGWCRPRRPGTPPSEGGSSDDRTPPVRRMMVEYGEQFWKHRWGPLYSVLGGNPLAAMPSLHFATSVNAAHLLAESGPVAGRARLDVRADARARARLPRRALRRRPARRARADRGRARARAGRRAVAERAAARRAGDRGAGASGT